MKFIAKENGYDPQLIETLIKNVKHKKFQTNVQEKFPLTKKKT